MREIPAAGNYPGKTNGPISIAEAKTGSVCAFIPVSLVDSVPPWSGNFVCALILADGTPQTRTIQNLCTIFGWDGSDPEFFRDRDFSDIRFEIVGEHSDWTPEGGETRTQFKIQYLNPVGGGSAPREFMDKKSLATKWGAKFRAIQSTLGVKLAEKPKTETKKVEAKVETKPAETPASQPAQTQSTPAASGPPGRKKAQTVGGQPVTATMEEAWDALKKARPNDSDEALGDSHWYTAIEKLFPGKTNSDLTIQQWGALKVHFES